MQKLSIQQQLSQKLSPQQIQFIKLLQIPAAELESRIEEELEINPALEEGKEEEIQDKDSNEEEFSDSEDEFADDDLDIQEYIRDEDVAGYKMQGDGPSQDDEERESPLAGTTSLSEVMLNQLGFLRLDERQTKIAEQLIGSIDEDGYIRRNLDLIVDDLAFSQHIETNVEEIEEVLFRIQDFDPAGIGARDLQECLLLQIER